MKGQKASVGSMLIGRSSHDDSLVNTIGEQVSESHEHPALSLVIYHLRLPELLAFQCVCKSFRDAIVDNLLLWRDVKVEAPLCYRITDDVLWDITSRATGKLRSLTLLNCWNITDAGLFRVIRANPCITKVQIPGCHKVTGDGVVSMMRYLKSKGYNELNQLRLHGVQDVKKEHLEILQHLLRGQTPSVEPIDADESIDIDICPKCNDATLVFDCTREKCRSMNEKLRECRGCGNCVPRCVECSGCLRDSDEVGEETECSDLVCLSCWLRLPKCNSCNMAHCTRHWNMFLMKQSKAYICESCVQISELIS